MEPSSVKAAEEDKEGSNFTKRDLDSKYFKDSFSSQDEFKNFMDNIFKDDSLTGSEKAFINRENFAKLTDAQKTDLNTLGNDKFLKVDSDYKSWEVVTKTGDSYVNVPYDWPDYMGLDLSKDVEVLSTKNMPKVQERIGTLGGNNFSPLKNETTGECFNMGEKSIECYIDNTANAQHLYNIDTENYIKVIDCIADSNTVSATTKLNNLIDEMNISRSKWDLIEHATIDDMKSYQNSYIKFKKDASILYDKKGIMHDSDTVFYGLKGQAAPWLSSRGGAGKINTPIKGYMMEDLGLLKESGGK
ncbi:hypothetical protein ACJDT4_19160 [Clostridium neuense]|uniref:DUF4885 domain-containing protein n=1 Tax=Clostridium neuense TaxID=1728934 RepID=A0ABW8TJW6_9CLOT